MRTFAVTYTLPGTCDCCGAALPVAPGGASPGDYSLELPEGANPTEVRVADSLRVTLGGGRLEVRLRQRRGSNREWAVKPLYNSDAFTSRRAGTEFGDNGSDFYWYLFSFQLPEYKPDFSTWWAQLEFAEVPFGTRAPGGHLPRCHNSATLRVRLTRLD